MNFVPIMLSVSGKRVIVIGGGEAAYKKVRNLVPHCSDIVIISDAFDSRLSEFPVEKLRLHIDDVEQLDSFLIHENIVIIATDDPLLNGKIASVCKARDILFNRVDDDRSPFIFPASFEYKGVAVSVLPLHASLSACNRDTPLFVSCLVGIQRRSQPLIEDFIEAIAIMPFFRTYPMDLLLLPRLMKQHNRFAIHLLPKGWSFLAHLVVSIHRFIREDNCIPKS